MAKTSKNNSTEQITQPNWQQEQDEDGMATTRLGNRECDNNNSNNNNNSDNSNNNNNNDILTILLY